jgi:hypothetical protein
MKRPNIPVYRLGLLINIQEILVSSVGLELAGVRFEVFMTGHSWNLEASGRVTIENDFVLVMLVHVDGGETMSLNCSH